MANDDIIQDFVNDIDQVVMKYMDKFESHNIAAILLSRVTHLVEREPKVGKELLKYVWEQIDEIEQKNLGKNI